MKITDEMVGRVEDRIAHLRGIEKVEGARWAGRYAEDMSALISLARRVLKPDAEAPEQIKAIEFAIYRYSDCSARDAKRGAPFVRRAAIAAMLESE